MNKCTIAGTTIALILAVTASPRAELRHVELKTLGMD
jgi:hypothetical protein